MQVANQGPISPPSDETGAAALDAVAQSASASEDPPPPPSNSELLQSHTPTTLPANSGAPVAVATEPGDVHAGSQQDIAEQERDTLPNEQTAMDGSAPGNPGSGEISTNDAPPLDGNRSDSSSDDEEQPYWAKFEEDKSAPTEEELKSIEEQNNEVNALDRKYHGELKHKPITALIHVQMTTGRSLLMNHLTTLNTCLLR